MDPVGQFCEVCDDFVFTKHEHPEKVNNDAGAKVAEPVSYASRLGSSPRSATNPHEPKCSYFCKVCYPTQPTCGHDPSYFRTDVHGETWCSFNDPKCWAPAAGILPPPKQEDFDSVRQSDGFDDEE